MKHNQWRYTWNDPKCGPVNYRIFLFILGFLIHPRLWTFGLFIICFAFFWFVEKYKGINMTTFIRLTRVQFGEILFGNGLYPRGTHERNIYTEFSKRPLIAELNDIFRKQGYE